jgi:tetratricopeptide (TPR) repeat protein
VCTRLDGVPLAIELAAARVRSLSIEQISAGLDDRFRLLAGGSRTALARQRTLEASVQWSYALLDPGERAVLRRLAVFQAIFDLAAAERIAGGGDVDEIAVLDLLSRLVDKSLVQADDSPTGELRYRLLDTIRHFGRDRLADANEADDALARHLEWVGDLSDAAEPSLLRSDLAVLARIDDHFDDVRAALGWACSDGERAPMAVSVVGALGFYWTLRGRFREGIEWCQRALAAAPDETRSPDGLRARWALAKAMFYGSDPARAVGEAVAAATDAAAVGVTFIEARCRAIVGMVTGYVDPSGGVSALDHAVALADESGDEWTIAEVRQFRAYANLFYGDLPAMLPDLDVAREIAERWNHGYLLGWDGAGRAWALWAGGDMAGALRAAQAGQTASRRVGVPSSDAFATCILCLALTDSGRPDETRAEIGVAEELFRRRSGHVNEMAMALARTYLQVSVGDPGAASAARHFVDLATAAGIQITRSYALPLLAASLRPLGDLEGAMRALDAADEIVAGGCRIQAADVLLQRARVLRMAGKPDRAEETAHGALLTASDMGFGRAVTLALEELAHLTVVGSAPEAARLLGASAAARRSQGLVPNAEERGWIDDTMTALSARLGEGASAAVEEGERLSLEDAVAYARRARGERGSEPR